MSRPLTQPDRRKPGSYGRRYIDRKWPRHARDFWLVVVTLIVLFALKGQNDNANQISRSQQVIGRNQRANTRALCKFRHDLQQRVDQGTVFLRTHPNGFANIPAAAIRVSIANEQSTVRSLSSLRC